MRVRAGDFLLINKIMSGILNQERQGMTNKETVRFDQDVEILLRDGTKTYADVYRPSKLGKYPVLLTRTPYDKSSAASKTGTVDAVLAASQGYAVVIQDVRGRYSSKGDFYTFSNESLDGYDSIEWAASQSWSSGKVGMYGGSYVGATQWLAAKSNPPSLTAIAPMITASDYHEGWAWQGGAFELGFNLSWTIGPLTSSNWENLSNKLDIPGKYKEKLTYAKDNLPEFFEHLPLSTLSILENGLAPYYYDWLNHPEYDDYWKDLSIEDHHPQITTPALNIGGWHDIFLGGTIRNFSGMRSNGATRRARDGQLLLIGPWVHGDTGVMAGSYGYGSISSRDSADIKGRVLSFYDRWLKEEDNTDPFEKPVRIFVMGSNEWRDEETWPLERAINTNFYFHSGGSANTLNGDGFLSQTTPDLEPYDSFLYNPYNPVPTKGGGLCCDDNYMRSGVYDQREIEGRQDVLVYSSPVLVEDLEVTGPVNVTLYASSSAVDTDFTAKLVDVDTRGFARNLTDGIIRARYRKSRDCASNITPGDIVKYEIDLWATSNVFLAGHSIRIEISSSNFPRFDRNMNTGAPIGQDSEPIAALQTVHHSRDYPSHITLPLVPS